MTNYKKCPLCGVKRLLYLKELKEWICYACFKTLKKVKAVDITPSTKLLDKAHE